MYIPRGTIVHENLATSYVLVEPLVADLCEGGFSGIVEVLLTGVEGFIVLVRGKVDAVCEKSLRADQSETYERCTVSQLAARARAERGSVSIRSYSTPTAEAVGGRMNAQSLYARLSIEFTDLETMLGKLARENDRDWFVEINTDAASDTRALIHVRDHSFHIIASRHAREDEWDAPESADDAARKELVRECKKAAGTFHVFFKDFSSVTAPESTQAEPDLGLVPEPPALDEPAASREGPSLSDTEAAGQPAKEIAQEISSVGDEFPLADDADSMLELKRWMGEIAGTIEGAAQAVDRRDGFGMCLRASQLKLADRYPFLDPFASEFEYLAGEIVFVGHATPEQFVIGLTEALCLAVESLAASNAHGERFRGYVKEDLGKLLARNHTELESYGLDRVIDQIASY